MSDTAFSDPSASASATAPNASAPSAVAIVAPLAKLLPKGGEVLGADEYLDRFLGYIKDSGISLYPAQEEAILELFSDNHVVLNTPTGSGKSLVALAACFKALCDDGVAFYTAPIKALVTEKFFELCSKLGSANVGMMTGDATVNRDAPIICCTAEILAQLALREGRDFRIDWVVMDEFHYYADRDRGVSWQLPLLTLTDSRFLLMSATMGNPEFFVQELEQRTGVPAKLVQSFDRPVPLDFTYSEVPLQETIHSLVEGGRVPVYIVHFSQRAATEQAQDLMSLNFLSKEEKRAVKDALSGFRFDSPFGRELQRFVPHGIGVHHAGMLPKYRRLVEQLAQKGLLRVICGTDTLGVGINVPIRTVLFTQLCKFDGQGMVLLSNRDFLQIAGRAGRKGFDDRGSVVVQAPEHEIENRILKDKASKDPKKAKKLHLKKPPERGYKAWNRATLEQLQIAKPESLSSSFQLNHGLLLSALLGQGGCKEALGLLEASHESKTSKRRLRKRGFEMFRSLLEAGVIVWDRDGIRVPGDLQEDFSLNQALSIYALEAFEALDESAADYPLVLLSIVEAIVEDPDIILMKQVDLLKTRKVAELKAAGVEFDDRMKELDKIEYPKPEAEFIYETFNLFAKQHPWIKGYSISPKSIARDMHEQAASFTTYVKEYSLSRAEGVLLRYLTDVYRTLQKTVPVKYKTDDVWDLEEWLGAELRSVDGSLIEEWERLENPDLVTAKDETAPTKAVDILTNPKAFQSLVRNAAWRFTQALARQDYARAFELLIDVSESDESLPKDPEGNVWTKERFARALAPYWEQHQTMGLDADARSATRSMISQGQTTWQLEQVLSDPEENLDWRATFAIDLAQSRELNRPVLRLLGIGEGPLESLA
jgi:superfamily II RNA helicase